jgi:glyoxylate reductase
MDLCRTTLKERKMVMRKTALVTRKIPEAGLELLRKEADLILIREDSSELPAKAEILLQIAKVDVLIALLTEKIDREILMANPRLVGVSNYAVGFDNIDLACATELGIPVTNTPGVLTDTTADTAWALIMATARRIIEADQFVREQRFKAWIPDLLLGADVSLGGSRKPKTLGIIGYGKIGQAVRRRAMGFDMRILVYSPQGREAVKATEGITFCELDELLRESDFITLHTPLSSATRHLIGARELSLMKKTAILINTARGPVVDEQALISALQQKLIAGAGLDVYEREPHVPDSLLSLDNVVLLPHIGSSSVDTRNEMARMAAQNALALLKGKKPEYTVNPEVYRTAAYAEKIASLHD